MKQTLLILLFFMLAPITAWAESPAEKGLKIAQEADKRSSGFVDSTVQVILILVAKNGKETTRYAESRNMEVNNDGDKSLFIFKSPPDVAGTVMLTHAHITEEDEQWIYLPAVGRIKRVSGEGNSSGSFMGSEFAFEDLSNIEVSKFTYKWLRDEACEGGTCHVVERYPTDKNSGYSKQQIWVDNQHYRTWKTDYFDKKGSLLKSLANSEFKEYLGKFWYPEIGNMVNHITGKATRLVHTGYKFKSGLKQKDFQKRKMPTISKRAK